MDANFISEAINTLPFPIAMVATLGWYIQKKDKEKNRIVNEKLLEANKELTESNRLLINEFSHKITSIENNVTEIKNKI